MIIISNLTKEHNMEATFTKTSNSNGKTSIEQWTMAVWKNGTVVYQATTWSLEGAKSALLTYINNNRA